MITDEENTASSAQAQFRLLRGADRWWFLGPGGVARLGEKHITPEGTLDSLAEQKLRDQGLYRNRKINAYGLTVLTSTDCNLGCGYCFQNTGQDETGGSRPPRIRHARLTSDTITTILEFARRQMVVRHMDKLAILLFGGEPLLNPRGCIELLNRAADYGLASAGMVSNLTLFTPALAQKLSDAGLSYVQVTFDGDQAEHDTIRIRRTRGGGTFDSIISNLVRASEATRLRWILRVNVSHHNYTGIDALVERLAGSVDPSRCKIYFVRVGDVGIGYGNDLVHTGKLAEDFGRWQRLALERGFGVSRPRPRTRCLTCEYGYGDYGAVVNADGTLSSCWDTAGKPEWEVGTVFDGYLPDAQIKGKWVKCDHGYQYSDEAMAREAFEDTVDAALLDYLHETGRI